jgi:predicted small secreted protein
MDQMKTLRLLLVALAGVASIGVAGCNTVEGLGRDVSAGGEAISDTADKTQEAISQ